MKVKNVQKAWYICYTEQSVVLSEVRFNESVWFELWEYIKELYDQPESKKPLQRDPKSDILKQSLSNYIDTHSSLITEVPSITGEEGSFAGYDVTSPYRSCLPVVRSQFNKLDVVNSISAMTIGSTTILEEAHELNHSPATEILAFILTDTDRIKQKDTIPHVPVAYALKGPSLPKSFSHQIIEKVKDKCKEQGVHILCEVSDGQFASNLFRTLDDKPLTKLQDHKKAWQWSTKTSKLLN